MHIYNILFENGKTLKIKAKNIKFREEPSGLMIDIIEPEQYETKIDHSINNKKDDFNSVLSEKDNKELKMIYHRPIFINPANVCAITVED